MFKSVGEGVVDELVDKATDFLRDNPGVAVAAAALAAQALAALSDSPIRRGSSRAAIRDWLDDANLCMPSKKQFESAVKSAGLPTTYSQFKRKLATSVKGLTNEAD